MRVNLRNLYLPCFVFPLHVWDVAQHDVDECVLDQAEEHEERTRRHENVNSLKKSKKKIFYHSCYQKDLDYLGLSVAFTQCTGNCNNVEKGEFQYDFVRTNGS